MVISANNYSGMVLYSESDSPESHCVRLVLAEKGISAEISYVDDGEDKPEILVDVNPYDSILTLMDRSLVLYDGWVIIEYLNERFPYPPLLPLDPVVRAENGQLRSRIMNDLYSLVDGIESKNKEISNNAIKNMRDHLTVIASVFSKKEYFMSDEYTLVDCFMAPLLWRLPQYSIKLPRSARPLQKYAEKLFQRDAFKASLSKVERGMC